MSCLQLSKETFQFIRKKLLVIRGQGKYDNHLHHMMWLCSASHQQAYSHWKSLTHGIFLNGEKFHLCLQTWAQTQSQLELIPVAKTTGFSRAFGGAVTSLRNKFTPLFWDTQWLFLLLGIAREAIPCDHVLLPEQRFMLLSILMSVTSSDSCSGRCSCIL